MDVRGLRGTGATVHGNYGEAARCFLPKARRSVSVLEALESLTLGAHCAPESIYAVGRNAGSPAQGGENAEAAEVLEQHENLAIATREQCPADMRNHPGDKYFV